MIVNNYHHNDKLFLSFIFFLMRILQIFDRPVNVDDDGNGYKVGEKCSR